MSVSSILRASLSALAIVVAGAGLSGCTGEENLGPVPIQKSQLKVFPSRLDMDALADVREFTIQRTDGQGRHSNLGGYVWNSLDPSVAQVDGAGRVVSLAQGTARIEVRAATGETARAEVVVDQVPVHLAISSRFDTLDAVGQSYSLRLEARDRNGFRVPRSSVNWNSKDPGIVTVDEAGTVTSRGVGETFVKVRKRGRSDSTKVRVRRKANSITVLPRLDTLTAVGQQLQMGAYLTDSDGNVVQDDGFTWTSSAPGVVSVTSSGSVEARSAGSAEITAERSGIAGRASIVVDPSVEVVTVTPSSSNVGAPGQTVQLVASGTDRQGGSIRSTYSWSSDNPSVATVDQSGLVTGVSRGTTRMVATAASGAKGFAAVGVGSVTLNITPQADTLSAAGVTTQYAIYPLDSNGGRASCPSPSWRSTNTTVADVNQLGQTLAKAAGTALIVVTACAVEDTASLTVLGGGSPAPPPPPPPPAQTGDPELPRLLPQLPPNGAYTNTVRVPAGGNLQAAVNAAAAGTEILLAPGATYSGSLVLPDRGDNGWVRIATDLNAPAGRVDTTLNFATITASDTRGTIFIGEAADGWELSLLEVTTNLSHTNAPIRVHDAVADVADRILIDRVYVHPKTHNDHVSRCALVNGSNLTIRYSVLVDCHNPGQQTQGAAGWNTPGPLHFHDNYVSAASQAFIFGGSGGVHNHPADVTIARNHMYVPAAWQSQYPHLAQIETKDVKRLLVEDNVIDGGNFAFLLKSSDQFGLCGQGCGTEHVTLRWNVIRGTHDGFNLARFDSGGIPLHSVLIENNLVENIGPDSRNWSGGRGVMMQVLMAPDNLKIRNNTYNSRGHSYVMLGNPPSAPAPLLVFENIKAPGPYQYDFRVSSEGFGRHYSSASGSVSGDCGSPPSGIACTSTTGADLSTLGQRTQGVVR